MSPAWMKGRLRGVRSWFLSARCALCDSAVDVDLDFCGDCERSLPALGICCNRCAVPLSIESGDAVCGECQQQSPVYASAHAPFRYAAPIDRLVQGAKYGGRLDWIDILSRRLIRHIGERATGVDAIAAVPLHRSRLRERGYNQSLELARPIAKRLGLPIHTELHRVRATPPQANLPRTERRKNVRDAFAATGAVAGMRVALIDDVMTSGATAEAATRCLLKAGAKSVELWILARA